jgi:phage terminase large subunit
MSKHDEKNILLSRGQNDPVWWVRHILGDNPWQVQQDILRALVTNREVNVRSCHSAGKSWVASRAALWFLFNHPDSLVITTAPTARQVRGILWKEMRTAHSRSKFPLGGDPSTTALRISPSWMAIGFTAAEHDPDRFQGFHAQSTMVIIDEACGVSEEIDTAVDSILSGDHSRLLRIGNPTNMSTPFGNAFRQQRGKRFAISAFDTPNFTSKGITIEAVRDGTWRQLASTGPLAEPNLVNPQWVAEKWKYWGETSPLFLSRILAEFPVGGQSMVFDLMELERAQQLEQTRTVPVVFGVDVARHGSDDTVVALRKGNSVRILDAWNGHDTMTTTGRVIDLANRYGPSRIHVDEIGLGAGVLDRLVEVGQPAYGINVAKPARDSDRFENSRAELFWNLRELIEENKLSLADDSTLIEQLAAIRYEFTSRGRIKLESKSNMADSPDRADAVSLAFAPVPSDLYQTIDIPDVGIRSNPWAM